MGLPYRVLALPSGPTIAHGKIVFLVYEDSLPPMKRDGGPGRAFVP